MFSCCSNDRRAVSISEKLLGRYSCWLPITIPRTALPSFVNNNNGACSALHPGSSPNLNSGLETFRNVQMITSFHWRLNCLISGRGCQIQTRQAPTDNHRQTSNSCIEYPFFYSLFCHMPDWHLVALCFFDPSDALSLASPYLQAPPPQGWDSSKREILHITVPLVR